MSYIANKLINKTVDNHALASAYFFQLNEHHIKVTNFKNIGTVILL